MQILNENGHIPDQNPSPKNDNQHSSQSQNNSGNIGREVDEEKKDLNTQGDVIPNETGIAENEENHSSRNYAPHAVNLVDINSDESASEVHPKNGPNHISNPGGTSQEDVDENNEADSKYHTDDDDYGI